MDNNNFNNMGFPPQGQPAGVAAGVATKASHTGLFIGIGCGVAAVAVAGTVTAMALNGVFMSKPKKVVYAGANTVEEMMLVSDIMAFSDVAQKAEYTVSFDAEVEDFKLGFDYLVDGKTKGMTARLEGEVEGVDLDLKGNVVLEKNKVKANAPILGDTVFVYDYSDIPGGELFEDADEDSIEVVNNFLSFLYNYEPKKNYTKEVLDAIVKEFKEMDIESVDSREFTINGKEKKCSGYRFEIDGDNIANIIDNIYDTVGEDYMDTLKDFAAISDEFDISDIDLEEAIDEIKDELEDMPEIEVSVYLNGMEYAGIIIEVEDEKMEILFQGGKRPTQNMKIKVAGEVVLQVKGETEDGVDKSELIVGGETVLKLRRDNKSGVVKVSVGDQSFKILAKSDRNSAELKVYDFEGMGSSLDDVSFALKISKGAKMPSMKGDEFDIGEASMEDLEDLAEDIKDALEDAFDGEDPEDFLEDIADGFDIF